MNESETLLAPATLIKKTPSAEAKYARMMELYRGYTELKRLGAGSERIVAKLKQELAECMAEAWREEQKTSPKAGRVDALIATCEDATLVQLVRDKTASGR